MPGRLKVDPPPRKSTARQVVDSEAQWESGSFTEFAIGLRQNLVLRFVILYGCGEV